MWGYLYISTKGGGMLDISVLIHGYYIYQIIYNLPHMATSPTALAKLS